MIRVEDTDATPNLEVSLTRDEAGQGTLHITNQGGTFQSEVTFTLGDASKVDEAFFAPGAFGSPAGKVLVASIGDEAGFQLGENGPMWGLKDGLLIKE